jgi:hypothetical protein
MWLVVGLAEILLGLILISLSWNYRFGKAIYDYREAHEAFARAHFKSWGDALESIDAKMKKYPRIYDEDRKFIKYYQWLTYLGSVIIIGFGVRALIMRSIELYDYFLIIGTIISIVSGLLSTRIRDKATKSQQP